MGGGGSFQRHFVQGNRLYTQIAYQINPSQGVPFMARWQTDQRVADTMRIHCLGLWGSNFYPRRGGSVLFDYTLRYEDITLDTFFFTNPRASGSAAAFGMFREDRPHVMYEQHIDWEQDLHFTFADNSVTLNDTATSGLPVSYESNNDAVARVDGTTLHLFRVGEAQITATQEGNDDYLPASPVTRTVVVAEDSVGILLADSAGAITVYPNPFVGQVQLRCKGIGNITSAYLTDMQGRSEEVRLVPQGHSSNNTLTQSGNQTYTLDLTNRPPAVYILTFTIADGRQISLRLLKQGEVNSH